MGKGFQKFVSKKEKKLDSEHEDDVEEVKQDGLRAQYENEQEALNNKTLNDEKAMLSGLNTLQWLERQRSLNKKGKKRKQEVDTKASKGRKIRYVEIPKLVNYFPATPERIPWTHERRDELFKSLFV